MKEVYIKINDLTPYDKELLKNFTIKDIVSIDELLSIIDNLLDEKKHLEDQIEEMKEPVEYEDDYSRKFDYSEFKMNKEW